MLSARALYATSSQPDHEERRLIAEYFGPAFPGWRSADAQFPQEVTFETGQATRFEKVLFAQHPLEPRDTDAREVEVLVSTIGPDGPYESVGRFTLIQIDEPQRFTFAPVAAHWIRLRVLSNNGGPYAALSEFGAYSIPRDPFGGTGTPRPAAKP